MPTINLFSATRQIVFLNLLGFSEQLLNLPDNLLPYKIVNLRFPSWAAAKSLTSTQHLQLLCSRLDPKVGFEPTRQKDRVTKPMQSTTVPFRNSVGSLKEQYRYQQYSNSTTKSVGETGFEPAMILGPKPSAFDHWATPLNKIEVRLGITPNTSTSFN